MTFSVNVDKRSIDNLESLTQFTESISTRIKMANASAIDISVKNIEDNIAKRSKSISRAIKVQGSQRGEFGATIKITSSGPRGGNTGGRGKKGRYSILIASRIFLSAEQGKVGRKAFRLPEKHMGFYVLSHTSGKWKKGRRFQGPLTIPQLGPYYFSIKSSVRREKISEMSRKTLRRHLNHYYSGVLRRSRY